MTFTQVYCIKTLGLTNLHKHIRLRSLSQCTHTFTLQHNRWVSHRNTFQRGYPAKITTVPEVIVSKASGNTQSLAESAVTIILSYCITLHTAYLLSTRDNRVVCTDNTSSCLMTTINIYSCI